jgi:hypothetical protein
MSKILSQRTRTIFLIFCLVFSILSDQIVKVSALQIQIIKQN